MTKYPKINNFIEKYIFNYKIHFIIGVLFFIAGVIFVIFLKTNYFISIINKLRGHEVSSFGLKIIDEKYFLPVKLIFIISGLILISFGLLLKFRTLLDKMYLLIRRTWQKFISLKTWKIALILLITALIFNGIIMFFVPEAKLAPDAAFYVDIARNLLNGEGYISHSISRLSLSLGYVPYPVFDYPPLLPVLMSLSFRVFSVSFLSAILINVIMGILLPLLIFLFALEITKEKKIALLSGILMLFDYNLIGFMSFQAHREPLFTCSILLCLIFLFRGRNLNPGKRFIYLALSGFFLGLTFLNRLETLILILPVIFLVLFWDSGLKKGLIQSAFVVLIVFLVVSPWLLRNYKLNGNPFGIGSKIVGTEILTSNQSYDYAMRGVNPPELSLKYIKDNLATIIKYSVSKVYHVIFNTIFKLLGSIILFLFCLVGIWAMRKEKKIYWPIFLFIIMNYLFYPIFADDVRHFFQLIPFLLMFASIGIFKIFRVLKATEKKLLVYSLVLICLFTASTGIVKAIHIPIYEGPGVEVGKIISRILSNNLGEVKTIMYSGHADILSYSLPHTNIISFPVMNLDNLESIIKKYNVNYIIFANEKDLNEPVYTKLNSLKAKLIYFFQPKLNDPNIVIRIYKLD